MFTYEQKNQTRYQILYFKEDAKGLPESKKKIFNYEVKSFNIFLKKKPN